MSEKFLTPQEVAERTGFSANTIRRLCHSGELPALASPGSKRKQFRIPESALDALKFKPEPEPELPQDDGVDLEYLRSWQ